MLILTQDRCTVCAEHTIGSKTILDAPDNSLVTWSFKSDFGAFGDSVCAEHTIVLEIILDAPDETPR
jgi:hypothetical protein